MVKNLPTNAQDTGSILGLGRSSGDGNGNLFQYSCLGNPMDGPWRRAWQPTPVFLPGEFHGQRSLVGDSTQSQAQLSN